MAAPTLQAEGTTLAVTTGAPAVVLPAHQADDILVCSAIYWGPNTTGDAAQIPIPSGWSLVGSQIGQPAGTRDGWLAWFWRRALGSSETITLTTGAGWDTGSDTCYGARVYVIRGAETSGTPWDAVAQVGPFTTAPNNFGAVTVSATQRMVVQFGSEHDNLSFQGTIPGWTSGVGSAVSTGTACAFKTFRQDNVSTSSPATANNGPTPVQGAYAWTGISFKPPTPPVVATGVTASATGSGLAPLPKLRPIAVWASATASRAAPVPNVRVIPGPCRATASRAVPTLLKSAARIVPAPPASATASFPVPTTTSTGSPVAPLIVPSASARANPSSLSEGTYAGVYFGQVESDAAVPLPRITITPPPASATASRVVPTTRTVVLGVPVAGASAQGRVPIPRIAVGPQAASATAALHAPNLPSPSTGLSTLPTRLRFARNTTTLALHDPSTLVLDPGLSTLVLPDEEMELVLDG